MTGINISDDERRVWYFWNHCLTNKLHPRRKSKREYRKIYSNYCVKCGREIPMGYRFCYDCRNLLGSNDLELSRLKNREEMMECADEYKDLLKRCTKRGTCDILAVHKQYLNNDPDRLSTEFLVGLICGKDYKEGKSREVLDVRMKGKRKKDLLP
jgi:hypothetical protein